MTSRDYEPPAELQAALDLLSSEKWVLGTKPDGEPAVAIRGLARATWLVARHDTLPAPVADTRFLAHSLADVIALLASIKSRTPLPAAQFEEILARHRRATPGPWALWLETDGGTGGCNVITIASSEADLYLWIGDALAPDEYWCVAAHAYQQIPAMVLAARRLP